MNLICCFTWGVIQLSRDRPVFSNAGDGPSSVVRDYPVAIRAAYVAFVQFCLEPGEWCPQER